MKNFPEVYFLRHGQTEWNFEGRFQGQKDSPLTALGRRQAEDQGQLLRTVIEDWRAVDVWVSPLGRTRETAEIALRDVPAEPKIVPELAEISVGSWEGLRRGEIEKLEPHFANTSQSERFEVYCNSPGGESYAVFSARIRLVLEALQRPTVIVAHGIVGRVLRGLWLGLERGQLAGLPGGQGCIFHLKEGREELLWPS